MIARHEWNRDDSWTLKIDTVKPDGRDGWTGLDRAVLAEKHASDKRLYSIDQLKEGLHRRRMTWNS